MINSKEFDAVYIKNSSTEFVVVARRSRGYVPVLVSENCGLDLMGFAASSGNVSEINEGYGNLATEHSIKSDVEEYHEAEIDIFDGPEPPVYFYWKGAMPEDRKDFLRTSKASLHQIFREKENWSSSPQAFFWWHLGPMIFRIERETSRQYIHKERIKKSRKRLEAMLTSVAMVGAIIATLFAAGLGLDAFDVLRSWLFQGSTLNP